MCSFGWESIEYLFISRLSTKKYIKLKPVYYNNAIYWNGFFFTFNTKAIKIILTSHSQKPLYELRFHQILAIQIICNIIRNL